jgi:PAS domain-containing protein
VGIALFDTDLRFERVNDKLAEISGVPVRDHLGHRPSEFNAAAGQLYEPILESVRDTGESVVDEDLSLDVPEFGIERHWKASYYPIRDEHGTLVGVGTAVRDTTGEVVGRRRGESLLQLARELATVADETQLVASLTEFLADAFKGRALLAVVDREQGRLEVASPLSGYTKDVQRAWSGFRMSIERRTPMCDAVRRRGVVHVGSDGEFARRYPEMEPERQLVGDAACVCVPVVDPVDGDALAVFRVGWPHQRPLTDTSRTLCETVASLVALAMNRIRLTEQLSADRFRAALDSMLHQVAIAHAQRDDQGHIADFVIDYMNVAGVDGPGRGADDLIGRSVLELYPRWRDSGMFDRFATVVDSGEPFVAERLEYHDELDDGTSIDGYWNLQVVRFGDGYLAASNDVSELVRLEHAEREAREVAKRERVAVELLQRASLPDTLPDAGGAVLDAIYRPASTEQPIGGDWYDAFVLPDGRLGLVIADVSGHGPCAASFMVQVRNVFRAAAALREQPDQVLGAVNQIIHRFGSAPSYFVTCCYGTLDPRTRRMNWASAGHPAPIISASGDAQLAEQRPGYPLAVAPDATYRLQSLALEPGDRVLLYTDGLFERRGKPSTQASSGSERSLRLPPTSPSTAYWISLQPTSRIRSTTSPPSWSPWTGNTGARATVGHHNSEPMENRSRVSARGSANRPGR